MGNIHDFFKLAGELTDLLKILKTIEENKLLAITEKSLTKLDACIKDEQVQVMKLKGLEKKREQVQASLGYGGLTFRQIINSLQAEDKKEAKELFNGLQKATNNFNSINKSVKTALEVNIYSINNLIKKTNANSKKRSANNNLHSSSTNRFV